MYSCSTSPIVLINKTSCIHIPFRIVVHSYCTYAGLLKPGGTVVEGTAGNTGIGLAHICNALGYKCVIFMPDTQSKVSV